MTTQAEINALLDRYPAISYLREAARARLPHFAFEYLDSGTGLEKGISRNRDRLDRICMTPRFVSGYKTPDLKTALFGREYAAPIGMAPVGATGLMWPGGEKILARAARDHGLVHCLSTVACETPETIGAIAGPNGWFQLYPFDDADAEADLVCRAERSGYEVLVVTVDVPVSSTRERQRRAGMSRDKGGLSRLAQVLARPQWALATARYGAPKFRTLDPYLEKEPGIMLSEYMARRIGKIDYDHLAAIRERWKGSVIIKGIMAEEDAEACIRLGMDGIVVSNHGARQLDAAPAAIDALRRIAPQVRGKISVLFDSGIQGGLDIARALALGAEFVLAGRAFIYGIAAAGEAGGDLVAQMLRNDLENNMIQLGVSRPEELSSCLTPDEWTAGG
ncbi:MAG: alpha-hydroxy-acid oxidizing protein [Nitratireductor sp.]|nr:alpha-hydroxy-acid oxidizing protein [Nitratireductor sp.]